MNRLFLLLLLMLVGCDGPTTATDNAAAPAQPPRSTPTVRLDVAGVQIMGAGPTQEIGFGAPQAEVLAAMRPFGTPAPQRNAECGSGPMEIADYPGSLQLLFADGAFAGWFVDARERSPLLLTTGQPAIGTRLADLRSNFSRLTVQTTSLGQELSNGGLLGGLLEGAGDGARTTAIWAGTVCLFR